jgi:Spy/CpxP family protein refolding chaperone
MAPTEALATFGGRSNDPFFSGQEIAAPKPAGQQGRLLEIIRSYVAGVVPIEQQIDAIHGQITAQLVGAGPIDQAQIDALEQQMFVLRRQRDGLDLEEEVEIRSALNAAQLVQIAQRYRKLNAARSEEAALMNPAQFPGSAYRPGDLFRDKLGYARGLPLTGAQWQQMTSIENADTDAFRSIQQQRHAVRMQISEALFGDGSMTSAQLVPLQQRASALKEQIDTLRLAMTIQIRALLTPAQLAKAA